MKKVEFYCNTTALPSGAIEEVKEFDEDITDEEIEKELEDWVYIRADATWIDLGNGY